MGSSLIWNIFLSIIHISNTLSWHDLDIGNNQCKMRKMDPLEEMYYILLWTSPDKTSQSANIDFYYENHTLYENESCIYNNCLFTHNMHLMNLKKYDMILYNGKNINSLTKRNLPRRVPNQIYGYVNLEPAQKFPISNPQFDDFFNITVSYKLDSDIPLRYFTVNYLNGSIVDVNKDIQWKIPYRSKLDKNLRNKINRKSELAAWFVSRCGGVSKGDDYVRQVNAALKDLGFERRVEIFCECGNPLSPLLNYTWCLNMLSNYYMFYFAFENSFSEDYITEKVLHAVNHDTVPIVYGGADYDKFLPKGSYIDACRYSPKYLAGLMVFLYKNRKIYEGYFKWRQTYKFRHTDLDFVGPLCNILNEENHKYKRYPDFRGWWNNKYIYRCNNESF